MSAIRSFLVCGFVLLVGCASSGEPGSKGQGPLAERLHANVREVSDNYNRSVQIAARRIADASPDPRVQRFTIIWKQRTFANCQRARLNQNYYVAYLDLWILALQSREFLVEGEGATIFGEGQQIAIDAIQALVAYIENLAQKLIPARHQHEVKRDVEEFAREHPVENFMRQSGASLSIGESGKTFAWLGKLTEPFSLGVKDTAASIEEVSRSIDEIADVVQNIPELSRWNAELLVLDMQNNPTIVDLRDDVDRANDNISRIVDTVEAMPASVQKQVSKTLDEIDAKQAGLRTTLRETRDLVGEAKGTVDVANEAVLNVQATLAKVEGTVQTVGRTTEAFSQAGTAWAPTLKEAKELMGVIETMSRKDPDAPPPDPNAPDDLESLARTAEGLAKAAPELRASIAEVKAMLSADELPGAVANTVDRTTRNMEGLIDHLTWRMIQLALAVAVVALGYRFAVARLVK